MRFYKEQHKYYCGIDLHARKMYVCILDYKGKMKVHQNINTDPELFFELIFPYIDDIVVGVECVFCWYWMADFCNQHKIKFILGHALYMKAIHGGKTKNDKTDSYTIANLIKGGNFPVAYPYPAEWRATRDLLRRRMYLSRRCSELVAHITNTNTQYNLPAFGKKLSRKYNHEGVAERFEDPQVRKSVEVDLAMINSLNETLKKVEWHIEKTARQHDYHTLYLLRSIPGIGQIWHWSSYMKFTISSAFQGSRISHPTPALFARKRNQTANGLGIPIKRSETIISSGLSRKPQF